MVVELEVGLLARNAVPAADVGLTPDFEVPLRDFVIPSGINKMLAEVLDDAN